MMKRLYSVLMIALLVITQGAQAKKLVGLVQVRNESAVIEQCLHALSLCTDAIVLLDDASADSTVEVVKSVAEKYHVEKIVCNQESAWEKGFESENRQRLLEAARDVGGTHFIVIDADEVLTAPCVQGNFLRNMILTMNPGDQLKLNIRHLWKSVDYCRVYFNEEMKYFIFCDDGTCSYSDQFLHVKRVPLNLKGGAHLSFERDAYALLHFGYLHWPSVLVRQAWYKCLERVRNSEKSAKEINSWYPAHKIAEKEIYKTPKSWLAGYTFFDATLFERAESWRTDQINGWFKAFGKDHFQDLEIWHIDWPS